MQTSTADSTDQPKLTDIRGLCETLGITSKTAGRMRQRGGGPPWIRVGPKVIRYPLAELNAWIASQLQTSERAA